MLCADLLFNMLQFYVHLCFYHFRSMQAKQHVIKRFKV